MRRGGLDPSSFPFEAGRRPYPGFASLEKKDAAIFFGRDAQIVRGLDKIRSLVRAGVDRMLVILGASGSGKSSFFRAGLWPRLKRDDRTWLPLPTIRLDTTHDWFAICGEIARRCINPKTKGLAIPRSENKLAEEVVGWYYDLTDRRPAESEMRKAVKQVLAALRTV